MTDQVGPLIIAEVSAEPLHADSLIDRIRRDDCGALVSFEGTVRSPSHGHDVLRLEYEAYERVIGAQLHQIAAEVLKEFELRAVLIVHRVGTVAVGEPAVVAAAVSPHRNAAFQGVAKLMDRVKTEAAIWKREVMPEGGRWVEGA